MRIALLSVGSEAGEAASRAEHSIFPLAAFCVLLERLGEPAQWCCSATMNSSGTIF